VNRPQRGELWLADLESVNPAMSRGTARPVLVLQSNALNNAAHPTTIVVPGSVAGQGIAAGDNYPLRVRIPRAGGMHQDTELMIDQVRAVANARLLQRLHLLPPAMVARIEQALVLLTGP
jgi:mRNA interferase MazF